MTPLGGAVLLLGLLLLGACADDDSGSAAGSAPAGGGAVDTSDESRPPLHRGGYESRPGRGVWRLLTAEPASSTVSIAVMEGVCVSFDHVEVEETEDNVAIDVVTRVLVPDENSSLACPSVGILGRIEVDLSAPLGDRTIVGGCAPSADVCAILGE